MPSFIAPIVALIAGPLCAIYYPAWISAHAGWIFIWSILIAWGVGAFLQEKKDYNDGGAQVMALFIIFGSIIFQGLFWVTHLFILKNPGNL